MRETIYWKKRRKTGNGGSIRLLLTNYYQQSKIGTQNDNHIIFLQGLTSNNIIGAIDDMRPKKKINRGHTLETQAISAATESKSHRLFSHVPATLATSLHIV